MSPWVGKECTTEGIGSLCSVDVWLSSGGCGAGRSAGYCTDHADVKWRQRRLRNGGIKDPSGHSNCHLTAVLLTMQPCGDSSGETTCGPVPMLEAACVFSDPSVGSCGDTSTTATCEEGKYVCPVGTYPASLCKSFGPPAKDGGTRDGATDAH